MSFFSLPHLSQQQNFSGNWVALQTSAAAFNTQILRSENVQEPKAASTKYFKLELNGMFNKDFRHVQDQALQLYISVVLVH